MALVAVKRKRLGRKLVTVRGCQYVFSTKVNLNIAMVEEEHVDAILAIKEACCGSRKKPGYVLPTDSEMYKWKNA